VANWVLENSMQNNNVAQGSSFYEQILPIYIANMIHRQPRHIRRCIGSALILWLPHFAKWFSFTCRVMSG